jgi:AcrR family transcriptional regulator
MTPSATKQGGARTGRPTEADPRRIAQVALRLFEARGYEAVTMEEVARAASVSRRTLFRHFPAKADLVWTGTDDLLGLLGSLAAPHAGRGLALRAVVTELFVPVLARLDDPEAAAFARRRLRLIARAPTLLTHPSLEQASGLVASLIAGEARPDGAPAPLVARALVAAGFAALQWWAEHGEGQPAREAMLGALRGIAAAMEA